MYVNKQRSVRLGLLANQENDCGSPDSFIGLGGPNNAAGNYAWCCSPDNGYKNTKTMGYILVR